MLKKPTESASSSLHETPPTRQMPAAATSRYPGHFLEFGQLDPCDARIEFVTTQAEAGLGQEVRQW